MRGARLGLSLAVVVAVSGAAAQPAAVETRPIATIDFYGQRTLDADAMRKALPIHEGDKVMPGQGPKLTPRVRAALSATPHFVDARVDVVCCAKDGGVNLFVGVREDTSPDLRFRPTPTGAVRLPADLVAHSQAVDRALMDAVSKGRAGEDESQGHALLTDYPEGRALQERNVAIAAGNLALLRRVLRESADDGQRAMAARFLGYAPDKQAVMDDLMRGLSDPYPEVRNDSMRALMVFNLAKAPPRIPYGPFVDLLNAPAWTDLNKSSFALMTLTRSRDPDLLTLLRQRSMPALIAMARWRDRDHSQPAYWILGRIGGLADQEIQDRWDRADAEAVIAAALRSSPTAVGPGRG